MMKNGTVAGVLLVIWVTAMGCATLETAGHQYLMRGQVLEVKDGTAYLCLGSEEGAKVGQVFTVRRYVNMGYQKGGQPRYRIDRVGTVRITEVETHMASAKIVTGDVKANDIVELDISNP
ncbi:MAG: hypothetical protein WC405_20455 [Syntrophales bacterium]